MSEIAFEVVTACFTVLLRRDRLLNCWASNSGKIGRFRKWGKEERRFFIINVFL